MTAFYHQFLAWRFGINRKEVLYWWNRVRLDDMNPKQSYVLSYGEDLANAKHLLDLKDRISW